MEIYARQQYFPPKETYMVIGLGGVGFWVALLLGMFGVNKLIVFDDDVIEISNLNRLPVKVDDVGKLKRDVLYKMLRSMRPDIEIKLGGMWKPDEFLSSLVCTIVFDCTDKVSTQKEIRKAYKHAIKLGYDGLDFTITNSSASIFGDGEGGYTVPSNVLTPVYTAVMGILFGCADWKTATEGQMTKRHHIQSSIEKEFEKLIEVKEKK